jgi:Ca2+-binding EF-hand superfamily protein
MKNIATILLILSLFSGCSLFSKREAPDKPVLNYQSLDANNSKSIDYEEYQETLLTYFDSFDKDRNGRVKVDMESPDKSFMKKADKNKDGSVNIVEFNNEIKHSFNNADRNKNLSLNIKEFKDLQINN